MARMRNRKLNIKNLMVILIAVLVIILIFTFIDYLIHLLKEEYAVPSYYFRNKIIYGALIGFFVYLFTRNKRLLTKSLIFSAAISILLQIRYFLEGYPINFVVLFLIIHFLVLFPISLITFKLLKNKI